MFFGEAHDAWFTVGWKMAVTIEEAFGREKLIETFCDQRNLLSIYNQAAAKQNKKSGDKLILWSAELIRTIGN